MIWLQRYHDWAFGLEKWAGSDTILHLNFGLGIWLLTAVLFWRPLRNPWLLLPVVLAEGANEVCDYILHRNWTRADTIHDIFWTLLWPVLLWAGSALVSRPTVRRVKVKRRRLWKRREKGEPA